MSELSLKEFFQARAGKRTYKKVTIDGRDIWLQSLTANEKTDIRMKWKDDKGDDTRPDAMKARRALTTCLSIVDKEGGSPIFTGADDEIAMFGQQNGAEAEVIDQTINDLSYTGVAALAKKSNPATASGS